MKFLPFLLEAAIHSGELGYRFLHVPAVFVDVLRNFLESSHLQLELARWVSLHEQKLPEYACVDWLLQELQETRWESLRRLSLSVSFSSWRGSSCPS